MLARWRRQQPPWDASHMPSQQGKIVIVTGANSGTGFETAKKLAEHGATVVLACRSETRGQNAVARIAQHLQLLREEQWQTQGKLAAWQTAGAVEFMQIDMGELASITRFATRFQERFDRLDLLVNNAGVAMPAHRCTTDGLESQFGINHVGAFELTRLLLDMLGRSSNARVVAVSSLAHRKADMDFASQARGDNKRAWADFRGYANSKMANLLFTYELDRRLKKAAATTGRRRLIRAVAAHPGMTHTAIFARFIEDFLPRFSHWLLLPLLLALPFNSVEVGTLPILFAATVESVEGGEYYGPDSFGGRVGYPTREISTPESYSEEAAAKLWTLSEELVGNRFDVR